MSARAKRWLAGGLLIAVIGLGASWILGTLIVSATPSAVAASTLPARDLRLPGGDGVTLAATYRPGARNDAPGVLLLHGNGASRAQFADEALSLAAMGYAVLTIDFRGHGESTARPHSFGWHEADDAAVAFRWLKRQQNGASVAVVGISLGGAAALLGRDGPLPADALVLQAVYPDIRRAIRNRIATITGRWIATLLEPF